MPRKAGQVRVSGPSGANYGPEPVFCQCFRACFRVGDDQHQPGSCAELVLALSTPVEVVARAQSYLQCHRTLSRPGG
jgi:hypothetical protein